MNKIVNKVSFEVQKKANYKIADCILDFSEDDVRFFDGNYEEYIEKRDSLRCLNASYDVGSNIKNNGSNNGKYYSKHENAYFEIK